MKNTEKTSLERLEKLNIEELRGLVLEMQEMVQKKEETITERDKQIDILTQEVRLLRAQRYGRKSEASRVEEAIENGQLFLEGVLLFNEAEAIVDASEEDEQEIPVKEHTRKKRKSGKQKEDLSKLRKEEEHIRIDEDELAKMFPNGYRELPEEITSQLEHIPTQYYVKEYHIHVYCAKDDNSNIVRAKAPTKLFTNSLASASMVSGVINAKYTNALPLYRVEQEFKRNEVPVSRQTMASWVIKAAERYFSLFIERLKKELFTHHVIHSDETPTLVTKDGRKAGSKSYMWVYRSNVLDPNPLVIFDYQMTRHASHPQEFLKDFRGKLVTDGYESYHKLARLRSGEIIVAGCWVHAHRKFKDALKGLGKSGKNTAAGSIAEQAVEKIGNLIHEDNKLDNMTSEERLRKRKEILKPLVDEFFSWLTERRREVTQKSLTGRAISYALNQEEYLRTFLRYGDVPMDNNAAEQAIRPFCIGKRNWIMSDTIHGAEASAAIYSIVETAKANNLKPYEYIKFLLEEIPKHMDDTNLDFLDNLLPWSEKIPEECHIKEEAVTKS